MQLGEIMNSGIVTIAPKEAASAAWSRMRRHGVDHLVVAENGHLRGIVSERDLGGPGPGGTGIRKGRMVEDLMTPRMVSAVPETTLREASNLMRDRLIGRLPVIDRGRLVGVVTATDVFDQLSRDSRRAPFPGWIPKDLKRKSGRAEAPPVPAHIRLSGVGLTKDQRTQIRRRLGSKLGKFANSIERVSLRVDDVNGPKGGIDKACRIKVVLNDLPSVFFKSQNASLDAAIGSALDGAERTVRRTLRRRRMNPIRAATRPATRIRLTETGKES